MELIVSSSNSVKLIELETLLINSQIASAFCISSSQDDKLSIIIDGGVYIFELWPSPLCENQTLTFLKYYIPASPVMPFKDLITDKISFLWGLKRKEAYEVAFDSTLSSTIEKPDFANGNAQVIQCEFSPLILNESYISCLTNYGLLEVFKKEFNKWIPIINITQLWMTHNGVTKINSKNFNYSNFKTTILSLKITSMKWLDEPEPTFVTSHKNGVVCFWKSETTNQILTMSVGHCLTSYMQACSLDLIWLPHSKSTLLIIGSASGSVKGFIVDKSTKSIEKEFNLWKNEDSITPNRIKIKYFGSKLFAFVSKRHILLIFNLSVASSGVEVLKMKWLEFPSAFTSLIEWENQFVISLQNHNIYILHIKDDELNYELEAIEIGVKSKHKHSYHCFGLALSRNKAIWIIISSPRVNYNSVQEITHLSVYTTETKVFDSLSDTTSCGLIEKICKKYSSTRLRDIADLLQLKRLELLLDDSKFKESYDCNQDSSVLKLQLTLWEAKLKQFCHSAESDSKVLQLETLIARKHATKMLETLRKQEKLSALEKKCLQVNLKFLSEEGERNDSFVESCVICNEETIFENIKMSSCSNSHKFPRCCISLLPCNEFPYATCRNCDSVALISFLSETDSHCIFCDGLLAQITKLRILDMG